MQIHIQLLEPRVLTLPCDGLLELVLACTRSLNWLG